MGISICQENKYCKDYWSLPYKQKKSLEIGVKSPAEYTQKIKNANGKELSCFDFGKYVKDKNLSLKQFLHGDLSKAFTSPEQSRGKGR